MIVIAVRDKRSKKYLEYTLYNYMIKIVRNASSPLALFQRYKCCQVVYGPYVTLCNKKSDEKMDTLN